MTMLSFKCNAQASGFEWVGEKAIGWEECGEIAHLSAPQTWASLHARDTDCGFAAILVSEVLKL